MDESKHVPQKDDDEAAEPAGDVDAYESEWYEVLKRRAEELGEEPVAEEVVLAAAESTVETAAAPEAPATPAQ